VPNVVQSGLARSAVAASQQTSVFQVAFIFENVCGAATKRASPIRRCGGMNLPRSTTVQEIVNGPRLHGPCRHMAVPEMNAIGDATRQHAVQYGVDSSR